MKGFSLNFSAVIATVVSVMLSINFAYANEKGIDRFKVDFYYQDIGYNILSQSERTVAVAQPFDIDFEKKKVTTQVPSRGEVGPNGFLMSSGLMGSVVIPETVYDDEGKAYTVTALADGAINYVFIGVLVLPQSLKNLNYGISSVKINSLYLPYGLQEISGINYCDSLKSINIPWNVKTICDRSLRRCGFQSVYFPPYLTTIGEGVLSYCDNLHTLILSNIEIMGDGCLSNCNSLQWANLPETLKSMGDGCFNDCLQLMRVSLPWSEIDMNNCFNGCPTISCIELLASEPYKFPENCFRDVDKRNCDLLVPEESLEKYMAADGWKDFYRINGVLTKDPSNVKEVKNDMSFTAVGGNHSIKIVNPDGILIEIIATNGEKCATVSNSGTFEVPISSGVYVVSSSSDSYKVRVI